MTPWILTTVVLAGSWRCPADIASPDSPCPDGVVDSADLYALLTAWGPCVDDQALTCDLCVSCRDDIVKDCTRDAEDLLALMAAWGRCPSSLERTEPAKPRPKLRQCGACGIPYPAEQGRECPDCGSIRTFPASKLET